MYFIIITRNIAEVFNLEKVYTHYFTKLIGITVNKVSTLLLMNFGLNSVCPYYAMS